jgi:simple sugar transport system permease protein
MKQPQHLRLKNNYTHYYCKKITNMKIKNILSKHEVILFLVILIISGIIGAFNRAFISLATIFEILRGSVPYALMGLGILPVLLLGEVDISFVGIAAVSSLVTHTLLRKWGYVGGLGGYVGLAIPIGIALAVLVGLISGLFNLPVFAVSLGFWLMLYGFNLFFISPEMRFDLPPGLVGFYGEFLFKIRDPVVGETGLHIGVIYVVLCAIFIWILLRYTIYGRGFYITGGNKEVAFRTGYNVIALLSIAMAFNGALAAFAGVLQCAYKRWFDPILFRGTELFVIAADVIGGVSITGGRGSVVGVLLGVLFIQVATRGLIYLGIPPTWQQLTVGILLTTFFVVTGLRSQIRRKFVGQSGFERRRLSKNEKSQ